MPSSTYETYCKSNVLTLLHAHDKTATHGKPRQLMRRYRLTTTRITDLRQGLIVEENPSMNYVLAVPVENEPKQWG